MKLYKVDFKVNGKLNPHGLEFYADSILCALAEVDSYLHRAYDLCVDSFEIVSVTLV